MLVRIKRQRAQHQEPYWQTFEYNNSNDNATVVTVLNALNYTDDLFDIEGNPATRIRWECSCMQGVCGGCAMVINNTPALACNTFLKDIKTLTEPKLLQWLKKYNSTPDNFTALKRYFAYASNRDQVIKAIMMRFATFENEYLQKIADKCKNKSYDEINKVLISHFNLDIDKCTDEFLKKKFTKATKLDDFIKMLADTREAEKKRKERKANLSSSSSSFFGMSSGSFSMHSRHGTAAVYGVKGQEYLKYCPNCGGKGQLTKVDMGNLYDLNNNTARTYQIQCPDCRGTGRIR